MGVLTVPEPTKERKQRSINQEDIYLTRYIYPWSRPSSQVGAEYWRWWVFNEPIAMICRETLIANLLALDWEISPRKSEDREEQKGNIRHYTRLLERGGDYYDFDWTGLVEWIMADLQDLPFGAGAEIGRKGDVPGGRVAWVKPLDGGTLYPTLNKESPVVQWYKNYDFIIFPKHAIARTYMSPRPELLREGWGLAPPEKIYFALLMLYQGDRYYADLLLDNPPAGILDLGDMEMDSALQWADSYKNFLVGKNSAFKIPVLYEHTTKTEFISFGKVPNDIMFDRISLKYAAIVAAAYGMSLGDIGLQAASASGQTLAGSIRDERKTRRTGFARAKKKIKYFIESFLPNTLEFNFIDLEGELNVELGRARLSTITALGAAQDKGVISAAEHRLILLGDGLFGSTNLPEEPPPDAKEAATKTIERPGSLGNPATPSTGGQGEVRKSVVHVEKSKTFEAHLKRFVGDITKSIGQVLEESKHDLSDDDMYLLRSAVDDSLFVEDVLGLLPVIKAQWDGKKWFKLNTKGLSKELEEISIEKAEKFLSERYGNGLDDYDLESEITEVKNRLHGVNWDMLASEFETGLDESVKTFLGKSATFILKDLLLSEDIVDDDSEQGYDLTDKVYRSLSDNFDEFVSACVGIETEKLVDKIVQEMTNV
jgi:hypothetical protein